MMNHQPEIAIVEANTLTSLGLKTILERMIPMAVIRTFHSFGELTDDTPGHVCPLLHLGTDLCGAQRFLPPPKAENHRVGGRQPPVPTLRRPHTQHLPGRGTVGKRHPKAPPSMHIMTAIR